MINRESLRHLDFDIELLGDCDVICNDLLVRLGDDWTTHCKRKEKLHVLPLDDIIEKGLREQEVVEERRETKDDEQITGSSVKEMKEETSDLAAAPSVPDMTTSALDAPPADLKVNSAASNSASTTSDGVSSRLSSIKSTSSLSLQGISVCRT